MTPRFKSYVLPASLGLNVFLAAVIGSHLWLRPPFPPPHGPHGHGPQEAVERIARTLSPADAAVLRREFTPDALPPPPPRPGSDDDEFERIRRLLAAEPFDAAALESLLEQSQQRRRANDQALARALLRTALALSPEGRQRLSQWQPHRPPPPR